MIVKKKIKYVDKHKNCHLLPVKPEVVPKLHIIYSKLCNFLCVMVKKEYQLVDKHGSYCQLPV